MAEARLTLPFEQPHPMRLPPTYARLRASTPVARVVTPDGQLAWLVTSYQAVEQVLSDPRFGITPPGDATEGDGSSLLQDGPGHARLRRLVGRAFTPRGVAALRPRIERLATDYAAAMVTAGAPADLVADFAAPLSITVIGELLGVTIENQEHFRKLADAASASDPFAADGVQPWYALAGYLGELVAEKRGKPGEDLISRLIHVHDAEDGQLSTEELNNLTLTIIAAGYLTARNAICVTTIQLTGDGRLAEFAGSPERVDAALNEALRLQVGLTGDPFPRWAREDVVLAGTSVSAGDLLLVRIGAAHRDPARFDDPDRFQPDRSGPSITFGHGPHHCLGAALARTEVRAALRALALATPALRVDGRIEELPWAYGSVDAGPLELPVRW